jgi:hypothetical protein
MTVLDEHELIAMTFGPTALTKLWSNAVLSKMMFFVVSPPCAATSWHERTINNVIESSFFALISSSSLGNKFCSFKLFCLLRRWRGVETITGAKKILCG